VYPNDVTNLYSYDNLNRLTNLVWKLSSSTLASFGNGLGPRAASKVQVGRSSHPD